jgi:hypothetical protein
MSREKPNKRYTPEFKKLVVETMMEEKLSTVKQRDDLKYAVTRRSETGSESIWK